MCMLYRCLSSYFCKKCPSEVLSYCGVPFANLFAFTEIEKVVDKIQGDVPKVEWDFEGIHYFVLDALNFCFWPGTGSTKKAVGVVQIITRVLHDSYECYFT